MIPSNNMEICRDRGLNPRPPDFSELYSYESGALPTKPPRLKFYCGASTSGGFLSSVGSINSYASLPELISSERLISIFFSG